MALSSFTSATSVEGTIREGARVTRDRRRRRRARRFAAPHSATHILHYALQKNLGKHAQQQGSKVDRRLSCGSTSRTSSPVESEQLAAIAKDVVERVAAGAPVKWETLPLAEARKQGAMMLFGEKYPDPVRMVSMGDFSRELCGGVHLNNTKEVGAVRDPQRRRRLRRHAADHRPHRQEGDRLPRADRVEVKKASEKLGVAGYDLPHAVEALIEKRRELRRALEAGVKPNLAAAQATVKKVANDTAESMKSVLGEAARRMSVGLLGVAERIEVMATEVESLGQQLAQPRSRRPSSADSLLEKATTAGGVTVVVADLPGVEPNLMRQLIDQIRQKAPLSAVLPSPPPKARTR